MDLELLDRTLAEHGEPAYRARQVWAWAARGVPGEASSSPLWRRKNAPPMTGAVFGSAEIVRLS